MNENKIFDKIMNKLEKILEKIDIKEKKIDEYDEDIMSTEKKSPTKKKMLKKLNQNQRKLMNLHYLMLLMI